MDVRQAIDLTTRSTRNLDEQGLVPIDLSMQGVSGLSRALRRSVCDHNGEQARVGRRRAGDRGEPLNLLDVAEWHQQRFYVRGLRKQNRRQVRDNDARHGGVGQVCQRFLRSRDVLGRSIARWLLDRQFSHESYQRHYGTYQGPVSTVQKSYTITSEKEITVDRIEPHLENAARPPMIHR